MEMLKNWISGHEKLIVQFGTASLVIFAITLILLPIIILKLPEDYFCSERRTSARKHSPPLLALVFIKNLIGFVFIVVGLFLLLLPGQGIITILIGLAITNFPGKHRMVRRITKQPAVGKTLNKIRQLGDQPPLQMPEKPEEDKRPVPQS